MADVLDMRSTRDRMKMLKKTAEGKITPAVVYMKHITTTICYNHVHHLASCGIKYFI